MVAAVRGAPMTIRQSGLVALRKAVADPELFPNVVKAFGFGTIDEYLTALEREGPRILRRMQW